MLGGLPEPSEDDIWVLLSSAMETLTNVIDRGLSIPSSLMSDEGAADWTAVSVHSPVRVAVLPALSFGGPLSACTGTFRGAPGTDLTRACWGRARFLGVATGGRALGADSFGAEGFRADAAT
jgi:hypothetical protein